jgi:dTMP kinase
MWVSVEGIEGVGKTHLARQLAARLEGRCVLLDEITDQSGAGLVNDVVSALSSAGDPFLRTGHPAAETLALIALKIREYERAQHLRDEGQDVVLEDRGIDTVAVYQAAIIAGTDATLETTLDLAQLIYATAARWRPLPDLTLLLTDDLDTCISRFQARTGHILPPGDRALIARASQLYDRIAAQQPHRFAVIDRAGRTETEVIDHMRAACLSRIEGRCAT